jgi:hypothetical protein
MSRPKLRFHQKAWPGFVEEQAIPIRSNAPNRVSRRTVGETTHAGSRSCLFVLERSDLVIIP